MESKFSIGTFEVEDAFNITNRGLILSGRLLTGYVVSGTYLVFEDATRWRISAVNFINHANSIETFGLLVGAPVTSRQELVNKGMIGAKALIFAE